MDPLIPIAGLLALGLVVWWLIHRWQRARFPRKLQQLIDEIYASNVRSSTEYHSRIAGLGKLPDIGDGEHGALVAGLYEAARYMRLETFHADVELRMAKVLKRPLLDPTPVKFRDPGA